MYDALNAGSSTMEPVALSGPAADAAPLSGPGRDQTGQSPGQQDLGGRFFSCLCILHLTAF